jgi:high affinity sulfate transporter 1
MSDDEQPLEPAPAPATAYGEAAPFRRKTPAPLLHRFVPVSEKVPRYRPASAARDLLAGVTVAALSLPSAMAYAELAGLSPVNGLYALLLPTVIYVLLGSSVPMVIGPDGTVAMLVASAVLPLATAGSARAAELAAMLALLTSAVFLISWLLRLGWIADYFSRPVLIGFLHGIAITLVINQLPKILGLKVSAQDPLPRLWEMIRELGQVNGATVLVSVVTLAVLFGFVRFLPVVPGSLVVVVGSIALSWAFDFAGHGIAVIGPVAGGLPRPTVPAPPLADVVKLIPFAVGVFLATFADEIMTARAFAGKRGEHVRAGQELLTMSAANAAAGFTQAFPVGASGARTAVSDSMGVRTQFAGLAAAGTIAVVLLFLTKPVQYLPQAVLGAVIVAAGVRIIDPDSWRALAAIDRFEVAIAAMTTVCIVVLGVLSGIVVAVGLSIIDTVRRSARPYDAVLGWVPRLGRYGDVAFHPNARVTPGVVVYRLDDRLFFANARYVKGRVREAIRAAPTETEWLVFDADAVSHVDSTGIEALDDLSRELRNEQVTLVVARAHSRLMEDIDASGLTETIGREHFYPTIRSAVEAYDSQAAEMIE